MRTVRLELEAVSADDTHQLMSLLACKPVSWQLQCSTDHLQIYRAESEYGFMEVCISRLSERKQLQLQQRKWQILHEHPSLFPVAYEHVIVSSHRSEDWILVLVREQTIKPPSPTIDKAIIELTQPLAKLYSFGLELEWAAGSIDESKADSKYFPNYFLVTSSTRPEATVVQSFLRELARFHSAEALNKIYLLEDQVYAWKIQPAELLRMSQEQDLGWMLLGIVMNLPFVRGTEVEYRNASQPQTLRRSKTEDLNGQVQLALHPTRTLVLRSGRCINQYDIISPEQLRRVYFEPHKTYRVCGVNCLTIVKQDNTINKNESFAIIEQSVEKIECVEFFIVYMKYFQLSVEKIVFKRSSNQLELTLANGKYVVIRFPWRYAVKEQELAIILNKSHLINCQLSLSGSQVSDKLLILLSNLDKMASIRKLDLSYCHNLTQFGLTSTFESGACCNLEVLNLSGTAATRDTLEAVKGLPNLKQLYLNHMKAVSAEQPLHLKDTKLQLLQAVGNEGIFIDHPQTLRVLMLTVDFPVENLKLLCRMPLTELKLRLVENSKQQIISFVSGLYSKTVGYAKEFCDGAPGRNLKAVDFSDSQIRYKLMRPILQLKSLVDVKLNGCNKLGDQFDTLGPDVELLEVRESCISARHLRTLLEKPVFVKLLDIRGSSLDKRDTTEFVDSTNKQFNEVAVDQQQYSSQLLAAVNRQKGSSINKLTIRVSASLNQKFLSMVYNISRVNKLVNFDCEQAEEAVISRRIVSFLGDVSKLAMRVRNQQLRKILAKPQRNHLSHRSDLLLSHCKSLTEFTQKICSQVIRQAPRLQRIILTNNRNLSVQCIDMLNTYCSQAVSAIDFRGCLFTFAEVAYTICEWPNLTEVNNGEFALRWQPPNFPRDCQRMLRFFMRVQKLTSLTLQVRKVKEVQLLFSVMYYIVNHHRLTLQIFKLKLFKINLDLEKTECTEFWEALLTTITLKSLAIELDNCENFEKHHYSHMANINKLQLTSLLLRLPKRMPVYPRIGQLAILKLFLSGDQFVNDAYLAQCIRYCENLQHLELELNCCSGLVVTEKFNSCLKRLRRLKSLSMTVQLQDILLGSCPIKASFLSSLLDSLKDLTYLNRLTLDISFTAEITDDVTVQLVGLADLLNHPYIEIVGMNVFRRGSLQFQMQLQDNNIRVVY